ncbi:MAG TPA: prolipoprotein diacylglyceryl transferase [Candidatus Aquilonibacter sp.]|nr:prolipoprotein diacylglyceryl transferase [Candidatus Aquilonibacter sp.]
MIPFLHLGPLTIPTYGLMVACAMLAAYFVLRADFARRGFEKGSESSLAELFIAVPCVCGIVGARLYHVLESPREFFADPWGQLFSRYGLAWFGGLIAGAAAWILLARRYKIPLLNSLDAAAPAAALGYGVGRLGCLLSGDGDYGKPTSWHWPWGMSFPNGLVPTTQTCVARGWPADCRVYPTPIYELIAALVITWALWCLGRRQLRKQPGKSNHVLAAGSVFALYLILTGVARFFVEFIRINPRSFLGMTNAQTASLLSIAAGFALLLAVRRRFP